MMNEKLLAKLAALEARKQQAKQSPKVASEKAEKIAIGYRDIVSAGKLYVLVRDVDELAGSYTSTFEDEDGCTIGVLPQLIFSDRESADKTIAEHESRGFVLERDEHGKVRSWPARERTYE